MKAELQEATEGSPLNWGVWASGSTGVVLGAGRAGQDVLALNQRIFHLGPHRSPYMHAHPALPGCTASLGNFFAFAFPVA